MTTFEINYGKMVRGEMSEKEWQDYCALELEKILDDNRDVLERIKSN